MSNSGNGITPPPAAHRTFCLMILSASASFVETSSVRAGCSTVVACAVIEFIGVRVGLDAESFPVCRQENNQDLACIATLILQLLQLLTSSLELFTAFVSMV